MSVDVLTVLKEFGLPVGLLIVSLFGLSLLWKYYTKELKSVTEAHKNELADVYSEHKTEILNLHEEHKKDINDLFKKIQDLYDEKIELSQKYNESIVRLTDLLERKS